MALSEANVRRAVTGTVSVGAISATAPTGTGSALTGFTDLCYVTEDGVTKTFPSAADPETIKAWQNNATVLTIDQPTEDNPTFQFALMESKLEVVQFATGVTATQTSTEGSWEEDTNDVRSPVRLVIDVVDGTNLIRHFVPRALVTEVGDLTYTYSDAVSWSVTVECRRDATLGYNVKSWATQLKS